mmetsp:Transcript_9290/g.36296  ORF Transcript_9290/g.36296 Transcript_9290/m.36296 type:complete len:251 (+) Transcript_9290:631-1383(+)
MPSSLQATPDWSGSATAGPVAARRSKASCPSEGAHGSAPQPCTVQFATMPIIMWWSTWQCSRKVPTASGRMSTVECVAGSSVTVSTRAPRSSTVPPCQCGVWRSLSSPRAAEYHRTRSPSTISMPPSVPNSRPFTACSIVPEAEANAAATSSALTLLAALGPRPLSAHAMDWRFTLDLTSSLMSHNSANSRSTSAGEPSGRAHPRFVTATKPTRPALTSPGSSTCEWMSQPRELTPSTAVGPERSAASHV